MIGAPGALRFGGAVLLVLAVAAAPWAISNQWYLLQLELIGIFAILAIALNLVLGYAGQISLGHAALFGVGAYTSAVLTARFELPFLVGAAAATVLTSGVGLLLAVPALRLAGAYLAMATMAFNLIAQRLMVNWSMVTGGPDGLPGVPAASIGPLIFDRRTHLYLVAAALAGVCWLTMNLIHSRDGRALRAVRDDEVAASGCGIGVYQTKLIAFAISAGYAGLAGSLFAHLYRHISPISFGLETSVEILLAVLTGGVGQLFWPIVGAAIVTTLPQLPVLQALHELRLLVYGGLLLGSVILVPGGIGGAVSAAWRRLPPRARDAGVPTPAAGVSANDLDRLLANSTVTMPAKGSTGGGRDALTAPILRLEGVSKRFGGVTALDGVTLDVRAAEVHGVIGPNGSGKTTALNLMSGIFRPDEGRVRLAELEITGWPPHHRAAHGLARTFQTPRLFDELSVLDNIMVGHHRWSRPPIYASMLHLPSERRSERASHDQAIDLAKALGLGAWMLARAVDLPHGLRRRVELARAVAMRPVAVLLDEPAAGLDDDAVVQLGEVICGIRRAGIGVLLIEHNLDLVMAVCDRLTVLDQGRVVNTGEPEVVLGDERVMEAYLGRPKPAAPGH